MSRKQGTFDKQNRERISSPGFFAAMVLPGIG